MLKYINKYNKPKQMYLRLIPISKNCFSGVYINIYFSKISAISEILKY